MLGLALASLVTTACATRARIAARIVGEDGRPVPGAVLYVETVVPGADFDAATDFAWVAADGDGHAPPAGAPPVTVSVPARLLQRPQATIVALAPGHKPFVLQWRTEVKGSIGLREIRLVVRRDHGLDTTLDVLSWPTFRAPALRARAREPAQAPLRAAFREAWEAAAQGLLTPTGKEKLSAQRTLDAEAGVVTKQ